jgi:hypothetical protein
MARAERESKASEYRVRYGRRKSDHAREDAQKSRDEKRLDDHKRDE